MDLKKKNHCHHPMLCLVVFLLSTAVAQLEHSLGNLLNPQGHASQSVGFRILPGGNHLPATLFRPSEVDSLGLQLPNWDPRLAVVRN
jgi:hypothetical protein